MHLLPVTCGSATKKYKGVIQHDIDEKVELVSMRNVKSDSMIRDIETIVEIIKDVGGKEAYLFGSIARGDHTEFSDIDIGVKGVPKNMFFKLSGRIMVTLNRKIDLVDLDEETRFTKRLFENEVYSRVL